MCGLCYGRGKYIVHSEVAYQIVTCDCAIQDQEEQDAS